MDIHPGTVVANRYRISRPLGRGGMGEVFAAANIRTGRPVAVKLLRSESKAKNSAVARFKREARAAGSINSDHVTEILDVEEDEEHGIVLVFELLEGESLIDRLKRTGPLSFDELHPIVEQVWIGLADAHKVGIIHRDLKPSNVFLEQRPDGQTRVKILDFGISKLPKEIGGETLTEMGQSLGTFSFMPPEQIGKAKTVDHRADIYACATLIYQALSGQLPYAARNILLMVELKAKVDPRRLAEAMGEPVDERLEAFLARALAREPDERFQTATEALAAWRDLRPETAGEVRRSISGHHAAPRNSAVASPVPGAIASPRSPRAGGVSAADLAAGVTDTTSDNIATVAIPIASVMPNGPPGPPRPAAGRAPLTHLNRLIARTADAPGHGAPQPVPATRPGHVDESGRPSSPTPVPAPQAANGTLVIDAASMGVHRDAPGNPAPGAAQGGPVKTQPLPASKPIAKTQNMGPPQGARHPSNPPMGVPAGSMQGRSSRPPPTLAGELNPQDSVPPASQDKTRIYVPRSRDAQASAASAASVASVAISQLQAHESVPKAPERQRRGAVTFVVGAIAFALVGFVIVAALMNYYLR